MQRREWLRLSGGGIGITSLLMQSMAYAGKWQQQRGLIKGEAAITKPVRLFYNENPYGPSAAVKRAVRDASTLANRYATFSTTDYEQLKKLIAQQEGLRPEQVMLTHGSTEGLSWVAAHFGAQGKQFITPVPNFDVVGWVGKMIGTKVQQVPLTAAGEYDYERISAAITPATGIITFCIPNNPTGSMCDPEKLAAFIRQLRPDITVLADEAYLHYTGADWRNASMTPLLREGKQVIITRTFSKVYGMAGLRIGYLLAPPELVKTFEDRFTLGFPGNAPNTLSVAAAIAALQDEAFVRDSVARNNTVKADCYKVLDDMQLSYLKSDANFIYINVRNAAAFRKILSDKGILVGAGLGAPPEYARVTMGTPEEMAYFYDIIRNNKW